MFKHQPLSLSPFTFSLSSLPFPLSLLSSLPPQPIPAAATFLLLTPPCHPPSNAAPQPPSLFVPVSSLHLFEKPTDQHTGSATESVCSWYIENIIKDVSGAEILFVPIHKCFKSTRPFGGYFADSVTDLITTYTLSFSNSFFK